MSRPTMFEGHRYVGDKRTQVAYDLDLLGEAEGLDDIIDELVAAETFALFGPDTLAEVRNRGYRPHRSIRAAENDV